MSKTVLNDDLERNEGDLDKQTSMTEFFGKIENESFHYLNEVISFFFFFICLFVCCYFNLDLREIMKHLTLKINSLLAVLLLVRLFMDWRTNLWKSDLQPLVYYHCKFESMTYLLDSICELSQYSVQLASMSTGPLVDMFNDEIKSIRDNAIDSLRKMGKLVTFSDEEV
jgi:hypothetical protein